MNRQRIEQKHYSSQAGFTLIEIMVVVVIISVLSALVVPKFFGRVDQARQVAAESDIAKISGAFQLYRLDNFTYPNSSEGIDALVTNLGNKSNWAGYLDEAPLDPWDNEYNYRFPGERNPNSFDLWSNGADGAQGGDGVNRDIGNWNE